MTDGNTYQIKHTGLVSSAKQLADLLTDQNPFVDLNYLISENDDILLAKHIVSIKEVDYSIDFIE